MKYLEKPITYKEQAEILRERGLVAEPQELEGILSSIDYFRLKGYISSFQPSKKSNIIQPNTTLKSVLALYKFDKELRILIFEAISEIEIALRSRLTYEFVHLYGEAGYTKHSNLPNFSKYKYNFFLSDLKQRTKNSTEDFVTSSKKYYKDEVLPLWMMAELMDMGNVVNFYMATKHKIRRGVAAYFNLPSSVNLKNDVFYSWLKTLLTVRNQCAHHSRFWNKGLTRTPQTLHQKKYPEWHIGDKINYRRSGFVLFMCRHLLKHVLPPSDWHIKVEKLFSDYPKIPLHEMGLPKNWQKHTLWKSL